MFTITNCIGGATIIKEEDIAIAWIDIYGDLRFSDTLDQSKKDEITTFLDTNNINYNKI